MISSIGQPANVKTGGKLLHCKLLGWATYIRVRQGPETKERSRTFFILRMLTISHKHDVYFHLVSFLIFQMLRVIKVYSRYEKYVIISHSEHHWWWWAGNAWSHLIYWGWEQMAAIFQMTFSNGFSWMKMYECWLKFHLSLFLRVHITIFQHWFR